MWSNTHTGAQGPVQCSSILYTAISIDIAVCYTPYNGCDLFKAHTLPPSVLKGQRFSEESLQPLQRFAKAQSRSRHEIFILSMYLKENEQPILSSAAGQTVASSSGRTIRPILITSIADHIDCITTPSLPAGNSLWQYLNTDN